MLGQKLLKYGLSDTDTIQSVINNKTAVQGIGIPVNDLDSILEEKREEIIDAVKPKWDEL